MTFLPNAAQALDWGSKAMYTPADRLYSNTVCDLQAALDRTSFPTFLHCVGYRTPRVVRLGVRNPQLLKSETKIMMTKRPVIVFELPARLVVGSAHLFFQEVEEFLKADRPRLVFDFSNVAQVDSAGVEVLLNCMEEAMKRNGDLKLAAIPPGPAVVLELTKVDRLFEIFDNAADAAESFHQFPVHAFPEAHRPWGEATQFRGEIAS
jgi:anti-sigma B factor antagonist